MISCSGSDDQQDGPIGASLNEVRSAFAPENLTPLKTDIVTRGSLMEGTLPFDRNLVAGQQALDESIAAAVVCGDGNRLLAVAFASEQTGREFLTRNPALSAALLTRINTTLVVWLKPQALPPNTKMDGVTMISEGVVPVYVPTDWPTRCSIETLGRPVEVELETLNFGGQLQDAITAWCVSEQLGTGVVRVGRRRELNPAYWAVLISKRTGLHYDSELEVFLVPDPQGQTEVVIGADKMPSWC